MRCTYQLYQIQEALGAGQKVFELLDRQPKITGQAKAKAQPPTEPLIGQSDHSSPLPHEADGNADAVAAMVSGLVGPPLKKICVAPLDLSRGIPTPLFLDPLDFGPLRRQSEP